MLRWRAHAGHRELAWRGARESCSLSSTSASNSARLASVKLPSILQSMSCCKRSFARGGKRRSLTDSTHSTGVATVAPVSNAPYKATQTSLSGLDTDQPLYDEGSAWPTQNVFMHTGILAWQN